MQAAAYPWMSNGRVEAAQLEILNVTLERWCGEELSFPTTRTVDRASCHAKTCWSSMFLLICACRAPFVRLWTVLCLPLHSCKFDGFAFRRETRDQLSGFHASPIFVSCLAAGARGPVSDLPAHVSWSCLLRLLPTHTTHILSYLRHTQTDHGASAGVKSSWLPVFCPRTQRLPLRAKSSDPD